jgi:hypothetical protein
MKSDRAPSEEEVVAAVRVYFEHETKEAGSRLTAPRRAAPKSRALPKGIAALAALAIVVVVAASAVRGVILAPGASASPVASQLPQVTAAPSSAPSPSAGAPTARDLPGSPYLSGSSSWMELVGGIWWSNDLGRSSAVVAYPAGMTHDQVETLAGAEGRPLWLAIRSGDGCRIYRKANVAAAWSSVLLTPSAAVLRASGGALFCYVTPGPGSMLTVPALMNDGSAVLFVSDDDGQSFVPHRSPAGSRIDMSWAWSTFTTTDSGVAIERTGPHDPVNPFFHTTDGGSTWVSANVVGLPATGNYKLGSPRLIGSVIEVPISTCGTCGTSQLFSLLVSRDGGATFNPLGIPTTYEETLGISFGNGAWAAPAFDTRGSSTWVSTGGGIIAETSDGGQTWTSVKAAGLPSGFTSFAQLVLTGPSSATAVVADYGTADSTVLLGTYLVETMDGGRTWTRV